MARHYTLNDDPPAGTGSIDYARELNEQQLAAVTSPPGAALVIAGAGSGKTRTLTYRVAYLLEKGVKPWQILLLTFTNKAAREMLERVEKLVTLETRDLWGGTFHSIGNRLLRRHAEAIGFQRNFSIMDREDQKDLMSTVLAEADIDTKAMRFPKPDVLGEIYSMVVNTGDSLLRVLHERYPYFEELEEPISKLGAAYEEKKKETNSMDFDDLLIKALDVLNASEELRERYQSQFRHILVDEYQDTNTLQARLIDTLAGKHGNVMAVGDDAQSIYSWRGANFRNILKFPERYPGAKVYKIETNYRSVPEILTLANAAIAANKEQFEKQLRAMRPQMDFLPALVPLENSSEQARFIAQHVLELRDEGIELEEMAVLYRAHFHSMEIQMEFTRRGIPFTITSGLRFFEQAHIKDVAAFMKFAWNRRDEVAFKRMARMLPAIGDKTADKLWRGWLEGGGKEEKIETFSQYLLEINVPAKAAKTWEQLAYTLDELLPGGEPASPFDMITSILEGVYKDYLQSQYQNHDARREDLETLHEYARGFANIEEFLSQLSLMSAVDTDAKASVPDKEAITMSTVHQAKGLEWKAVFVIGLADGMFPSARSVADDPGEGGLEEERRLFYVAVTRAKDQLYLTYPMMWHQSRDGHVLQRPSRFLQDFPKEFVEEWTVGRGPF